MIRGSDEGGFMARGLDSYRSVVVGVGSGAWRAQPHCRTVDKDGVEKQRYRLSLE